MPDYDTAKAILNQGEDEDFDVRWVKQELKAYDYWNDEPKVCNPQKRKQP